MFGAWAKLSFLSPITPKVFLLSYLWTIFLSSYYLAVGMFLNITLLYVPGFCNLPVLSFFVNDWEISFHNYFFSSLFTSRPNPHLAQTWLNFNSPVWKWQIYLKFTSWQKWACALLPLPLCFKHSWHSINKCKALF